MDVAARQAIVVNTILESTASGEGMTCKTCWVGGKQFLKYGALQAGPGVFPEGKIDVNECKTSMTACPVKLVFEFL